MRILAAALFLTVASRGEAQKDAMPIIGFRLGTPVIVSMYVGPTYYFGEARDRLSYLSYVFEPGVGGGQVGLAFGHGRGRRVNALTMAKLQASLLRTWGPSWAAPSGKTFAGAELQVTHLVGPRVGYFRRLGRGDATRDLVTLGLAFGY